MSQLSNLATPDDVQVNEKDSLGGFNPLKSDLYKMKIDLAFIKPSASGALGMNMHYSNEAGEQLREVLWVVSGDAKGNRNYYDGKDGVKRLLPGLQVANAISQLTLQRDVSELDTEEKVISLYDSTVQSEVPTKVQMITDLLDKEILLGIKHNIVDKNVKNSAGQYVPSGETREENVVAHVFSAETGMTIGEVHDGKTEAEFVHKWKEKWEGVTTDKSTKVAAAAGVPGGAATAGAAVLPPKLEFPGQN